MDFPWEVLEYLSWLRQQPSSRGATGSYLFDEPKVRFGVAEHDVIVADRELQVVTRGNELRLIGPRTPAGLALEGLSPGDQGAVRGLLGLFDGARTLAEVRLMARPETQRLDALLAQAFGNVLFAPLALVSAERTISGIEVTRFPGSPYEISRPYWTNMGAVRTRLDGLDAALDTDAQFLAQLRELHVIALMGEDLQSYYQPASPISSGRAAPGRLMTTATQIIDTAHGSLLVQGPRVNAATVGGARYHEALYRTLEEPEAGSPRHFIDSSGIDWGRLVHAMAPSDAAPEDWFCPPRPLRPEHVRSLRELLRAALDSAARSEHPTCLQALAGFHQNFIRLHPFHCGNQCLAMNIVNRILGQLLGAGIPHLMLDHLALRLSTPAYAKVFRRCVGIYVDPQPSPLARYLHLAASRTKSFELIRHLSAAASPAEADDFIQANPASARLLLLTD